MSVEFMGVAFENAGPKAKPMQLRSFEKALPASLPGDYRRFLVEVNGGSPPERIIRVPVAEEEVLVHYLFGVGRKPDILDWRGLLRRELPEAFIPIAKDPGGNFYILGLAGDEEGKVCYWDAHQSFKTSSSNGNTYPLTDSFTGFLALLK